MNLIKILKTYFNLSEPDIYKLLKLNIKKINLWGFTNRSLLYNNQTFRDIQSQINFDPNLSKIVLFDKDFFYSIYLNPKQNYYFNNLMYLYNKNFYNNIAYPFTLINDNDGPIGFKMKKLTLINDNNLDIVKRKTNIIQFYEYIIKKQNDFEIIMADIDYTNCGIDENNKVFLFDIDSYVDKRLFTNKEDVRKEISNIELFWLLDRGQKMFNKLIDKIFDDNKRKQYYISYK